MSKDDSDIHWNELYPTIITRKEHVIFKFNNRLCVVAGRGPEDEEHCRSLKYDVKKSMGINVIYFTLPLS